MCHTAFHPGCSRFHSSRCGDTCYPYVTAVSTSARNRPRHVSGWEIPGGSRAGRPAARRPQADGRQDGRMAPEPLTRAQIDEGLAELPGWSVTDDRIERTYAFQGHLAA